MATLTLSFPTPLNTSVQKGDVGYFVEVINDVINNTDFDSNYTTPNTASIQKIGIITSITTTTSSQVDIDFDVSSFSNIPGGTLVSTAQNIDLSKYFIMFAKDNSVNLSSVLGYYAKARFTNNSTFQSELFSVSSEIQQSSK